MDSNFTLTDIRHMAAVFIFRGSQHRKRIVQLERGPCDLSPADHASGLAYLRQLRNREAKIIKELENIQDREYDLAMDAETGSVPYHLPEGYSA